MKNVIERDPGALYCRDPSLTKQAFKDECDINKIMSMFRNASEAEAYISTLGPQNGSYFDCTQVVDFRTARDQVLQAEQAFKALPANVRSRFENDPAQLVEFCADPANRDEMVRLGLLKAKIPVAAPVKPTGTEGAAQASLDVTVPTDRK